MQVRQILLILLFGGLAFTFLFREKLGGVASYIATKDIASSLFGNFSLAVLLLGFVMFASILGALYLVSEGK